MHRILVVANETLEAQHLLEEVNRRIEAAGGPEACAVHLVVPMAHGKGAWTEGGARSDAQARLDDGLILFKELHVDVSGEIGDVSPARAVSDAFLARHHDEIVVSTLPAGISRWLKQDAVSRIRREHPGIPVTHVSAESATGAGAVPRGMSPSLLWFRRDLRLADNPALLAAIDAGAGAVAGVFVLDERLWAPAGPNRRAFLAANLRALDKAMGGRLVVRRGDPVSVVPAVAASVGAGSVHVAADFGPYGRSRDGGVERALAAAGVGLVRTGSPYVVEPGTVRTRSGAPFKVFTPFFRAWSARSPEAPSGRPSHVRWVGAPSDGIPAAEPTAAELPAGGEEAAHHRMDDFLENISGYDRGRNRPDLDATSRLSPYLKYGVVHPRQLLHRLPHGQGAQRFRAELAWREFYADVLWHHPDSTWKALQPTMQAMAYDEGPEADERFAAWAEGRTGFPLVDAGMRQLVREGWMHNRVRMITASFLVKDLHLDWRRGARHFLHHLVDGDLASNHHGWQWVAGTGTDPAPYFRVFNPTLQGQKFDPSGEYVRRYVPELGTDAYPAPIVDHAAERREALVRYAAVRA